jgi:hypothetical protein
MSLQPLTTKVGMYVDVANPGANGPYEVVPMHPMYQFLSLHSIVHSAEVSDGQGEWFLADLVVQGLSEEQLRMCPPGGGNSISWLYWHMARTEDAAVNLLIAGGPQVLDDDWLARLHLTRRDIGTGMTDEEVEWISSAIYVPAIFAYRNAVGRRTREVAFDISPEALDEVVDAVQPVQQAGAVSESAVRVARFWHGKTKRFLFNMPASGHCFMHLSEALTTRRQLGL